MGDGGGEYRVYVLLLGESGVGKTTLAQHLSAGSDTHFDAAALFPVTLGVEFLTCRFPLRLRGGAAIVDVVVFLMDMPGGLERAGLVRSFYRNARVILMLYDVTRRDTFDALGARWWPDVRDYAPGARTLVVVGNKSDLLAAGDAAVPLDEARAWAVSIGAQQLYQCSAKMDTHAALLGPLMVAVADLVEAQAAERRDVDAQRARTAALQQQHVALAEGLRVLDAPRRGAPSSTCSCSSV
jgi:GTPase SAR1 family protein